MNLQIPLSRHITTRVSLHLNNERYSEAVTAFQNAITLDPDFTTAYYNLGLAHYEMEMYPRAVDVLQKAIVLDSYLYSCTSFACPRLPRTTGTWKGKRCRERCVLKLDAKLSTGTLPFGSNRSKFYTHRKYKRSYRQNQIILSPHNLM